MRRSICVILSALFLFSLCTPCAAADTAIEARRAYPGFSDVPAESAFFDAVKTCYETGLMNGRTETAFDTQSPLSVAQLVVLTARLFDIEQGGDGTIPDLPDLSQHYLRFYGPDGTLLRACTLGDVLVHSGSEPSLFISLSNTPEDPALPETCTLEAGFDGYTPVKQYEGVRESYTPIPGVMSQGLTGTGYRFEDPAAFRACFFITEGELAWKDAWWFPAAFYLASQGRLGLSGELISRVRPEEEDFDAYDPLVRFSEPASRALFAWLVDAAADGLPVLHETVTVPDVNPEETRDAASILRLYQAGVLTGVDESGRFNGGGSLIRGQAALILHRVLDPTARI